MTTNEIIESIKKLYPTYGLCLRELHTYMRYEMAKKYNQSDVPTYLPADWIPNRWAQDWSSDIQVEGINLDSILKTKGTNWITEQTEAFYGKHWLSCSSTSFREKSGFSSLSCHSSVKKK